MHQLSVEEALERILEGCKPLDTLEVASHAAAGSVLVHNVVAPHALPPFANSAMDGYALRAADIAAASPEQPAVLPVAGVVPAGGTATSPVQAGTAARIMTGAPLPQGADTIVPIEEVEESSELPDGHVRFVRPAQQGRHVRLPGEDVAAGDAAIPSGTLLRPAAVGMLAALGVAAVQVVRRPRVGIISTGDELLPPGQPLSPGKIYDANGPALQAFVAECGAEGYYLGIAHDTHTALREYIDTALRMGCDLLLTSAGASAGDYDMLSGLAHATESNRLQVWRIQMKPGRPLVYGRVAGVPLIGLPGNPASALIAAELFVRPAIERLRGLDYRPRPTVRAVLEEAQRGSARRHYVRARLLWEAGSYRASTRDIGTGSGSLSTLVRANGLLIIPEGATELAAGEQVEALLL
jgi:molybdopterin molybdotransferase